MQSVAEKEESNVMTIDPPPLVINHAYKLLSRSRSTDAPRTGIIERLKCGGIVLSQVVQHLREDESSGSESKAAEGDHVHGGTASRGLGSTGRGNGGVGARGGGLNGGGLSSGRRSSRVGEDTAARGHGHGNVGGAR